VVTVSQLRSWQPGRLAGIGDRLARRRRTLVALEDELSQGAPPASWVGVASVAAQRLHRRLTDELVGHVAELRSVAGAIDDAAAELARARRTLDAALAEARTHGFEVADDGTVTSTKTYRSMWSPEKEADERIMRGIARDIGDALTAAHDADAALAAELGTAVRTDPDTAGETLTTITYPSLADPGFADWYRGLTGPERQAYRDHLGSTARFDGFDPLSAITPGPMPAWAARCRSTPSSGGSPFDRDDRTGTYGYVGGGTIAGPGEAPWPIVMPYLEKDGVTYLDDAGPARADGGIMQHDGHDPGWRSVASYRGVHEYTDDDEMGVAVGVAGALAGLSGNRVYPEILYVTADGAATLDAPPPALPDARPPAVPDTEERAWLRGSDVRGVDRWNTAVGGYNLGMKAVHAVDTIASVASHEQRPWFIDYQVNDDGRIRAIVRTFQAGTHDSGSPAIGSFANTFAQVGSTEEYAYARRVNGATVTIPGVSDSTLRGESSHRTADLQIDLDPD